MERNKKKVYGEKANHDVCNDQSTSFLCLQADHRSWLRPVSQLNVGLAQGGYEATTLLHSLPSLQATGYRTRTRLLVLPAPCTPQSLLRDLCQSQLLPASQCPLNGKGLPSMPLVFHLPESSLFLPSGFSAFHPADTPLIRGSNY